MSSMLLPRRFYNQPQGAVEIDWSNPITNRLTDAVSPDGKNLTNLTAWNRYNGDYLIKATQYGLALGFNNAGILHRSWTAPYAYGITLFAIVKATSSGFALAMAKSTSTDHVCIYCDTTASKVNAYLRDGAGNVRSITDSGTGRNSEYTACAVTLSRPSNDVSATLTAKLYIDGVLNGETTWAWGQLAPDNKTLGAAVYQFGALPGGSNRITGDVVCPLFFERVLSSAEIKSLSANPWQIFRVSE